MTTTADPTTPALEFGKSRTRKEDARLITGRTRWTDNITLPGMLHLAVVRSSAAHARITGIDADEARALPGVIAVYTAADLGLAEASLPNAWPITPDQKAPQAPPLAVDTVHFAGDGVAVVIARDAGHRSRRHRARRRRLRRPAARAGHGGGARRGRHPAAPGPRHERERALGVRLRRGRHGRERPRRDRRRREGPRCDRRPAAVPPAAAHPGVHGAPLRRRRPVRRAADHVVGDADPAHPQDAGGRHRGRARAQAAGDRPGRRRRVRRQAAGHARGDPRPRRVGQAGQAGQVDRDPLGVAALGPPRPRPDPGHHDRSQAGRHRSRPGRRPARRHGCLPAPGDVGHPDPRRVHVQLDLQVPGLPVRLHERVHLQDPHRRLPRRRPAGGHVRHRADHGRAGGRAGPRAAGAARAELDQARGVPVHHGVRAGVRLGQLRGRHRQGQGAVRLRRAAPRAAGAA